MKYHSITKKTFVQTRKGFEVVFDGDWIVKYENDTYDVLSNDDFQTKYKLFNK
jgi:hypothetical protein